MTESRRVFLSGTVVAAAMAAGKLGAVEPAGAKCRGKKSKNRRGKAGAEAADYTKSQIRQRLNDFFDGADDIAVTRGTVVQSYTKLQIVDAIMGEF